MPIRNTVKVATFLIREVKESLYSTETSCFSLTLDSSHLLCVTVYMKIGQFSKKNFVLAMAFINTMLGTCTLRPNLKRTACVVAKIHIYGYFYNRTPWKQCCQNGNFCAHNAQ